MYCSWGIRSESSEKPPRKLDMGSSEAWQEEHAASS